MLLEAKNNCVLCLAAFRSSKYHKPYSERLPHICLWTSLGLGLNSLTPPVSGHVSLLRLRAFSLDRSSPSIKFVRSLESEGNFKQLSLAFGGIFKELRFRSTLTVSQGYQLWLLEYGMAISSSFNNLKLVTSILSRYGIKDWL
jgi:hypothetical protein